MLKIVRLAAILLWAAMPSGAFAAHSWGVTKTPATDNGTRYCAISSSNQMPMARIVLDQKGALFTVIADEIMLAKVLIGALSEGADVRLEFSSGGKVPLPKFFLPGSANPALDGNVFAAELSEQALNDVLSEIGVGRNLATGGWMSLHDGELEIIAFDLEGAPGEVAAFYECWMKL